MNDKVAIITGSSRGIGKACALKLASSGYKIVINYLKSKEQAEQVVDEIKALGTGAIAVQADVSQSKDVQNLFRLTMQQFKRLDVLVNNTGIVEDAFVMMMSDSSIDKMLDINVKSYFYCCRNAVLNMMRNRKGKIINISSLSSIKGFPGQSLYGATKGAINSMTRILAKELIKYGITVNAVAPGFVKTEMVESIPDDKKNEYLKMIPMNRFGETQEIAELVNFLSSDAANYITGQIFVIDGGLNL